MNKIYEYLGWVLTIYITTILMLTSIPSKSGISISNIDKLEHFLAYFVLAFLIYFYTKKKKVFNEKKVIILCIIISGSYGVFDELHQLFIPGRSCEFYDWIADMAGTLTGTFFASYLYKFDPIKSNFE